MQLAFTGGGPLSSRRRDPLEAHRWLPPENSWRCHRRDTIALRVATLFQFSLLNFSARLTSFYYYSNGFDRRSMETETFSLFLHLI